MKKGWILKTNNIVWIEDVVQKLVVKHNVKKDEVEEVVRGKPKYRYVERGDRPGEDVYVALGRTESGRYLSVIFVYKLNFDLLVLSARDMNKIERKWYGKK